MPTADSESRLHAAFTELADIPNDEWRCFWAQVRERHFSPREHLFRQDKPAPCIHYIVSGLVRMFYNEDGREIVRGFDYETRFATAYESVLTGGPATFSCQALEPTHTATTVRVRNGRMTATDGPFAETKEQLAGFYYIEARDLDAAIEVASRIPPARLGSIEIRPVRQLK